MSDRWQRTVDEKALRAKKNDLSSKVGEGGHPRRLQRGNRAMEPWGPLPEPIGRYGQIDSIWCRLLL